MRHIFDIKISKYRSNYRKHLLIPITKCICIYNYFDQVHIVCDPNTTTINEEALLQNSLEGTASEFLEKNIEETFP